MIEYLNTKFKSITFLPDTSDQKIQNYMKKNNTNTLITRNFGHLNAGTKTFGTHKLRTKAGKNNYLKWEKRVAINFGHFNFGQIHPCPKSKTSEIFGN